MSKINEGLYSSADHTWCTPPDFIEKLLKFEQRTYFDIDPCCSDKNIPAIFHFIDGETDGLNESWTENHCNPLIYINPPYGSALKDWVKKCYEESIRGARIWLLIPARTETIYQHEYGLTKAGFTIFMKGRMKFLQNGESKGTAPFPTMLLYYGHDAHQKAIQWKHYVPIAGTIMRVG